MTGVFISHHFMAFQKLLPFFSQLLFLHTQSEDHLEDISVRYVKSTTVGDSSPFPPSTPFNGGKDVGASLPSPQISDGDGGRSPLLGFHEKDEML